MSIEKAQIKMGTIREVGILLDDALEGAQKEVHKADGAKDALRVALKALETLGTHVDKDVDEGQYDLEVASKIKRYVIRAQQMVTNLLAKAENEYFIICGQVKAYERSVEVTKKLHDMERGKAESLLKRSEEADVDSRRPTGAHPGKSLKEQRLEEEANGDQVPSVEFSPSKAPKKKAPPKRRSKKKKKDAVNASDTG